MTLDQRITLFAQRVGDDIQALLASQGTLTGLSTTDKTSLVNAINEVASNASVGALLASNNFSDVAEPATARTNIDVRSSSEITSQITSAIAAITLSSLGGLDQSEVDARVQLVIDSAPAALDTLNELAAALNNDANFSTTIANQMSKKVDVSSSQTFTVAEKLQGCTNLGIGDPDHDFLNDYVTSRDN